MSNTRSSVLEGLLGFGIVLGAVAGVGFLFYNLVGYCSRCRNCKAWWSVRDVKREKLQSEQKYGDVEREDSHYDTEGKKVGSTKRKERVYYTETTYKVARKCDMCNQQWESVETVRD